MSVCLLTGWQIGGVFLICSFIFLPIILYRRCIRMYHTIYQPNWQEEEGYHANIYSISIGRRSEQFLPGVCTFIKFISDSLIKIRPVAFRELYYCSHGHMWMQLIINSECWKINTCIMQNRTEKEREREHLQMNEILYWAVNDTIRYVCQIAVSWLAWTEPVPLAVVAWCCCRL